LAREKDRNFAKAAARWSLSLETVERIKEELKGRRAAMKARYDDELQAIEADLANIETLELAAALFVSRYQPVEPDGSGLADLVPAEEAVSGGVEPGRSRNWRALLQPEASDPAAR
jgi:hypothetical protein